MGDMFAALTRVFFSLLLVVAGAWMDGKEGARSRRFSFLVSFLRLLRLLREALVGLRLVWVPGRGGRGTEMEPCWDDGRKRRRRVVCELRRLGLSGRQGDGRFLHRLTVDGVRRFG